MAAFADLTPRIEALERVGFIVHAGYRNEIPAWLQGAMPLNPDELRVLNVKGVKADDVVCMLTFSALEKLVASANLPGCKYNLVTDI